MKLENRARLARSLRAIADEIDSGAVSVVQCSVENDLQESSRSRLGMTPGKQVEQTGFQVLTLRLFRPENAPRADPEVMKIFRGMFGGE